MVTVCHLSSNHFLHVPEEIGKYSKSRREGMEALLLPVDKRIFHVWLALCFISDKYDIIHVS